MPPVHSLAAAATPLSTADRVAAAQVPPAGARYLLKDFPGSSHRLLSGWMRDLPAAARVLELGCGPAHVAQLAGRRDLKWIGLESSLDCLATLSRDLSGGAIVDLNDLQRLPSGFDVVLLADILEHLVDPAEMLRRIHDCLRPDGRLLVSVPNVANLWLRLNLLVGRWTYADRGLLDRTHRYFFTRRSLRSMLAEAGFAVERETVSTIPLPLAFPAAPRPLLGAAGAVVGLATRAWPALLGYQLIAEARRV
jgi:SAM-dependent methyltransferase